MKRPTHGPARSVVLVVLLAFGLALGRPAIAAEPGATNKAVAEALFDEGRKLLSAKDYARACRKFEESQKLDEGIGTLLYLGDCYEQMGRTASAWATFREAASKAHAASETERERLATRRASALEPKLARLSLRVDPQNDADGFEIRRDGQKFDRALFSVSVPLDPGTHSLEASAPGKKSWKGSVTLAAGETATVGIPALENGPPAPAGPAEAEHAATTTSIAAAPETSSSSQRVVGYVLGGIGVVGLGVGTGYGLAAKKKNDEAVFHCQRPGGFCDQQGVDAGSSFKSLATITNVAIGVGAGALVVGTILILTAPSSHPKVGNLMVAPEVGSTGGSIAVTGKW